MFSTYEINGEKKNMAVTQFEPVDARRCFPCWDEPVCKVCQFKTKNWSECVIFSLLMVVCWCFVGYIQDHIGSAS